ncbi:hypothetical protein QE56_003567 [Salmonella enterica subsp. enterica serovar Oranienburg]|nr:hypothetical protein [Salmonella enterica subsp. enterica serovar Oranienburg]
MNVACDGPSGRGPWMGRVIRSQHISNLKYEGYKQVNGKPTDIRRQNNLKYTGGNEYNLLVNRLI